MNQRRVNLGGLPHQVDVSVGVPIQVLIFAAAAVLAFLVGLFSPPGGFALLVLGLLLAVIVDYMVTSQADGEGASAPRHATDGGPSSAGGGDGQDAA